MMVPVSGFAGRAPLRRGLQPVIAAVADHMRQRILDQLQHLAVEFGLGTEHGELDLFAHVMGEITHQTGQLVPGNADGLHPGLHYAFLKVRRNVRQPLQRDGEGAVFVRARQLEKLVAGQHKFTDQRHQVLQHIDRHADCLRAGWCTGSGCSVGALGRGAGRDGLIRCRFRGSFNASGDDRSGRRDGGWCGLGFRRRSGGGRSRGFRRLVRRGGVQLRDEVRVVSGRFSAGLAQRGHDRLDRVDCSQNLRDNIGGDGQRVIAELA